MGRLILGLCTSLLIFAHTGFSQTNISAQEVIDRCIQYHGGEKYENCSFEYDFRDKHYTYSYDHGDFFYTRSFMDENGKEIRDELNNGGFKRFVNGKTTRLDPKKKNAYANSVNSVHYFAFLPFFLNDAAVQKELLEDVRINGSDYYKVRVTFSQEGGGEDYEDIHVYWINKSTYAMDYLGYSYLTDGGGVRFREAYNTRRIGGILFQDYINFKHDKDTPVEKMDQLFNDGQLQELSRIDLLNISAR